MSAPKVYVICDSNCKYEGMTKEQILTAIANAIATGEIGDCDTGFITTVKTINGTPLKFFVGTQDEYIKLSNADKQNLFAIITNDTTKNGIENAIKELQTSFNEFKEGVISGDIIVPNATNATRLASNSYSEYLKTLFGVTQFEFGKTYEGTFTNENLLKMIPKGTYVMVLKYRDKNYTFMRAFSCVGTINNYALTELYPNRTYTSTFFFDGIDLGLELIIRGDGYTQFVIPSFNVNYSVTIELYKLFD